MNMGLFSSITDRLSGKTYQYNTSIAENVAKILKNVEHADPLYNRWVTCCLLSSDSFLDYVCFNNTDKGVFDLFKRNLSKTDTYKMFGVLKLIALTHLFFFTVSNNTKELFNIDSDQFEEKIIQYFECDNNLRTIYQDWKHNIDKSLQSIPIQIFKSVLEIGFDVSENNDSIALSAFFPTLKLYYTDVFLEKLKE